jgi:hypothetical protein
MSLAPSRPSLFEERGKALHRRARGESSYFAFQFFSFLISCSLFLILFCHQDSKSPSFTKLVVLNNGVNSLFPATYLRTLPDVGQPTSPLSTRVERGKHCQVQGVSSFIIPYSFSSFLFLIHFLVPYFFVIISGFATWWLILFCHQDSKSPSFTKLVFLSNGVNSLFPATYFRTLPGRQLPG